MAEKQKRRTFDITEPSSLAKLSGVQVAVTSIEELAMEVQGKIPEKRGVVSACRVVAKRIFDECLPINAKVQAEQMDAAEAKIRIDEVKRISAIVTEIGDRNQEDIKRMEGEVEGHKKAANVLAKKYEMMAIKYERDERIQREDEEDQRESEPPSPPPKKPAKPATKKSTAKKPVKRPVKKSGPPMAPKGKGKDKVKGGQDS